MSLLEIQKQVEQALVFKKEVRKQELSNQKLTVSELQGQLSKKVDPNMIPHTRSHRRHQSLLRVSRTIADLDQSQEIQQKHLEQAQRWTASDIYKLERFRMEDFAVR